jgi:(p)ppGpp synthase/HD superfamily hydrolase
MKKRPDMLARAIGIAAASHAGKIDKCREPYILHPLAVMAQVETIEQKIVAVLHDVVEDSDVSLRDLSKAGFSERILGAVDAISKRKGEKYWDYIERVRLNPLATVVKIADLRHNSSCLRRFEGHEAKIREKYKPALAILRGPGDISARKHKPVRQSGDRAGTGRGRGAGPARASAKVAKKQDLPE